METFKYARSMGCTVACLVHTPLVLDVGHRLHLGMSDFEVVTVPGVGSGSNSQSIIYQLIHNW